MKTLPQDPAMLLSVVNTLLRDQYPSLAHLCDDYAVREAWIREKLASIGYYYSREQNAFV